MAAHSSPRSLMPREHGAYGQLVLPLLTALFSGRPTAAAFLYAAAAVFAFFAHEPLLVLLGQRGSRAFRELGARARLRLTLLAVGTLLCAGLALMLSSQTARLASVAPLGGALALSLLIFRKEERTDWGEIVAAFALSAAGLPVAVAGGVPVRLALCAWGIFSLGFGLVTLSLRRAIYGQKQTLRCTRAPVAIPLLSLSGCWLVTQTSAAVAVAAAPVVGMACTLLIFPPSPKQLHRIGWLLVLSTMATGLLLVRAAHG